MRMLVLSFAVLAGLGSVSGCSSTSGNDAAAIQAMNNPPNACGPDGSQNINDCDNRR